MKNPIISIVMPVYNAEEFVGSAIESMLSQTFTDFECIVIDDCSTDNSWKIIQSYAKNDNRVIAVKNEQNLKLSKTLNKGIEMAKGKYIARMDADDISLPNRLQLQYIFMEEHPSVGIVGGTMEIMNEEEQLIGKRTYHLDDKTIRNHIFLYSPYSHPLIMLRKSVLDKAGLYRHEFNPAEDYELYFRIGLHSEFANLPDTLLRYRIKGNSMTTGDTRNMELKTIEIRNIYSKLPTYTMTLRDKVYNLLQYISLYLIPSNIKMWMFNKLRNSL